MTDALPWWLGVPIGIVLWLVALAPLWGKGTPTPGEAPTPPHQTGPHGC